MRSSLRNVFDELEENYNIIRETYKVLELTYDMKLTIHPAGQWLLDNMYVIDEDYGIIQESKKHIVNKYLPTIKTHNGEKWVAIYYLAYELIEKNTGYIDQNLILACLNEHQKYSYLTSEELDLFSIMLRIAVLKFIARVCRNISNSQMQKIKVEKILQKGVEDTSILGKMLNQDLIKFKYNILEVGKIKNTNTSFVEYMAFRIKELGSDGGKYYEILKNEAERIGFSVEEAIIKEHNEMAKTTEYIGRSILAFKQLNGINFREIFEKVNKIDEALVYDYTDEFRKCDYKTKARYREQIIKIAKTYKLSEVYVSKKAVECSEKYKKHVGFFLIGDDRFLLRKELGKPYRLDKFYIKNIKPLNEYFYIYSIILIGLLFSVIATVQLFNFSSIIASILVALISFCLGMEIWEKLLNYMIRKSLKPKVLPRFDFAKTVDEKNTTYIVMPTVISSIEKLDNMIKKMEVTYLANRSENMYYMLLGDCVSSDTEHIDIDDVVLDYARNKLDILNEKYSSNHKLFNFIYRKRAYCKSENCYMGWERKRGAITQFNKLVLEKLSNKEIEESMYLIYEDIVNAKYAITIDEDTSLSLNTAKDLVSIVAHPLNKPVLSKNKKIVEKGYGLIQPAVSLDIESANKSIFSKIFGGFGGLDIYTAAVSNVYQDTFEEAIFCGKGIYDIELFETLLSNEIPENLVLSHDLLEGSFLKAGLASDIEVQDSFPNNYIAYMRRNHRWQRGDIQILKWLVSPKSNLNFLSKWKIYDNLRRASVPVFACIAILMSVLISMDIFINVIVLTFIATNFGHILSIIDMIVFGKSNHLKEVQYIPLIHGKQAVFLTMVFEYITLPYRAYMMISATILSLYRMFISKKHLLEWTTAEMIDKAAKDTIYYYFLNMISNVIFGGGLIYLILSNSAYSTSYLPLKTANILVASFFVLAPFFAFLLGKSHLFGRKERLGKVEEDEILEIAKRTWTFFDTMMTPVNNYLPTDNFQENRRHRIVNRTSSTNIGLAILAVINAYDLNIISEQDAIVKLNNIFNTIDKLEKWNGHLLNWYNIKTLEPLRPRFVSTVDSGNFVASLYVAKQFLIDLSEVDIQKATDELRDYETINILIGKIDSVISNTDFTKLYDATKNLFSIGYAQEIGKLIDSYYDMLMSESRITSLIAIASRQVTSKHWFSLSRNMVNFEGYTGLVSWTGTAFEYYMASLFNKSYEHTLIDQSLFFAKYCQKKYAKENGVPWGVSESAFAVRDSDLNYQYQAFGIPCLGLKRGLKDYLVISPYSSLLMLEYAPQEVYKNIKALKKVGAYSTFGFYESIDYTKQHLADSKSFEVVQTYMTHHQGMILTAINNYINKGIIKKRFHESPDISACEILLKERERMKSNITKKVEIKDSQFKQKQVERYTSHVAQKTITSKDTYIPNDFEVAFLKGKNMSAIYTNTGASYLRYKDKIVNKQKYTDMKTSGNYVYITDKNTNETFCVLDGMENIKKYTFTSTLNSIDYYRETKELETTTTVFLSQQYNTEVIKISIYNNTDKKREIVINTYLEPALTDYITNIVHPAFNNLQIETYYDKDLDILVASKRVKEDNDGELYVYTKLLGIDLDKDMETEKKKLVDINKTDEAYSAQISKYPLWPILSYRASIILTPHERQEFYYVTGVEDNKYKISNTVVNMDIKGLEKEYKFGGELNNVTSRYLELKPGVANIYNQIIKQVLFGNNKIDISKYWNESMDQSMLWKYSISGDFPIILVYINKIEDSGIIEEVINFMDYAKNRKVPIDVVALIDEEIIENGPIYTYVKTRVDRATYIDYTPGNIYVININKLDTKEIKLFSFLSKKYITNIDEFFTKEDNIDSDEVLIDENEE